MRHLRARAAELEADESLWDKPMPVLPMAVDADLTEWTEQVLANKPVPIALAPGHATHVMMSDASAHGWAVVVWDIVDGTCSLYHKAWRDSFPIALAEDSTKAEPEAIYRSLCQFLPALSAARVIFFTDHQAFIYAHEAGHGKSFFYNTIVKRIADGFPHLSMELRHVPGVKNLVDGWSRGSDETFDEAKVMGELRAYVQDLSINADAKGGRSR